MAFWAHVASAFKHFPQNHTFSVCFFWPEISLEAGRMWLAKTDNLHGASGPGEGGTSIWFARCSSALMTLPTGRIALPSCRPQWRASLQLINGSCLSCVPSSPHQDCIGV